MPDARKKQEAFLKNINYARFACASKKKLSASVVESFQELIYDYYHQFGRTFVWRQTTNPYHIVVSEIMLQQTQTSRVSGKFEQFVSVFPDFQTLAQASLRDVLYAWQGLGYNRRGKALHAIAQKVVTEFDGKLPADETVLQTLPGIGAATAASICAFAFNTPTIFVETNIRTVFIQFFFNGSSDPVKDKEILPLVAQTIDTKNPRLWYYALTDYGVGLKKLFPGMNARSAHYAKQSKFEGSDRQIRGEILRIMITAKKIKRVELVVQIGKQEGRVCNILEQLIVEGFLKRNDDMIVI